MGVDYVSAKKLIQLSAVQRPAGTVLMLGRHKMQVKDKLKPALDKILNENGYALSYGDLEQDDGYAEGFFKAIGYKSVVSMDLSDYEGAEILHDLNDPAPKDIHGKFNLIYDGGTTEHVFDIATCMSNMNELLAPKGVFSSCVPGNGFFAHGFYQFGPELVYGYWKHGCGFEILTCSMLPEMPRDKELPIPDPAIKGNRPRMRGKVPDQRVYLYYEVRKSKGSHPYTRALQTDYVNKWSHHDISHGKKKSSMIDMRKKHVAKATKKKR